MCIVNDVSHRIYFLCQMVIFLAEAAPLSLLQITDEERVSYHDDEVRTSVPMKVFVIS